MKTYISFIVLSIFSFQTFAQSYSINFEVKNQPKQKVILGKIKGDDFMAIDSSNANSDFINFKLPDNSEIGVYRIILGPTQYAKIMKEAPQQLDFIFNRENISIKTNFKSPFDSAQILQSDENKLWFSFLKYEQNYRKQFAIFEKEVDYLWAKKDTANALEKTNEFNRLQMARDLFIGQNTQLNSQLFAAQLIALFREPIMDGYLSKTERKDIFQKEYFNTVDFTNEQLINSAGYTDKIFQYLVTYNQSDFTNTEREAAYKNAVDIILANSNKNEKVYRFIVEYLNHGFEVLQMQNLIDYINTK